MDPKEQPGAFTLEDIMREFGGHPEELPPEPETPCEELGPELIPIPDPRPQPEPEPLTPAQPEPSPEPEEEPEELPIYTPKSSRPACGGETIRMDPQQLQKALHTPGAMEGETLRIDTEAVSAMTGQTQRLDAEAIRQLTETPAEAMEGATVAFSPVSEEQAREAESDPEAEAPVSEAPVSEAPVPEGAEPFSENWEPSYEQPMGEYVPPEPIVFRPRSRLQEMKKKLVAGPERRYYALAEQGVGKLQVAIFISLLTVILSGVSIGLHQMALVQPQRMRLLVFGELFAMLFSAILASDLIFNGLISALKLKFNLNSLLAMSFLVCMADGFFCLRGVRVPFCAAFCLEATTALWAEYQRRSTEMGQMDTLRKATRLNRIAKAPDCYDGRSGFYTAPGEIEDFMDVYAQPSQPEQSLNLYALLAFLLSAAIGVAAGLTHGDWVYALQMWSAAILAAAPATIFVSQSRPAAVLERRLHRFGVVLCGWKGIKSACGRVVIPLSDQELFPAGSLKVNGVKFYSKRDPDEIIAYAAALMELSDTALAPLFSQILDNRYGPHLEVEQFRVYESGGFGGQVQGEAVLVGSLDFVQEMGVHVPDVARTAHAIYAVIDGALCCQFAMAFGKLKGVSAGLATLCAHQKLNPMLVSCNFLLTPAFLQEKLGADPSKILIPSIQQRLDFSTRRPDPEASVVCALSTQESLAATGFAISGARALSTAARLGAMLHICGGLLGLAIVLALQFVDAGSLLTPASLLLYQLIWAVPGLLLTEWTRGL